MKIKSIIKFLLITIVTLSVILVAGAIALVIFVDPNHYKPLIVKAVKDSTGRTLTLDGNISWKFYPTIGLHIGHLTLSNPQEFEAKNFVEVGSADVTAQLFPLLHGKVVIDGISVSNLNVGLIKKGDLNNWSFNTNKESQVSPGEDKKGKFKLQLSYFALKNSTISYSDLLSKTQKNIKNFDLTVSAGIGGEMSVDTENEVVTLSDVKVNFSDIVNSKVNFSLMNFDQPQYQGKLDIENFSLAKLVDKLDLKPAKLPLTAFPDNVSFNTKFSGNAKNATIDPIDLKVEDSEVKVSLNVESFSPLKVVYKGNVDVPTFSLNRVFDRLAMKRPDLANKTFLDKVSFHTDFNGGINNINIDPLTFKINDSTIGGNIKVTSITPLVVNEDLNLNKLELSDLANLKGYHVPLLGTKVTGTASLPANSKSAISALKTNQKVVVKSIKVYGLSVTNMLSQIDNEITHVEQTFSKKISLQDLVQIKKFVDVFKDQFNSMTVNKPRDYNQVTDLGALTVNANVANGVMRPKMNLTGPVVVVNGDGTVNLVSETLDYKVNSQVVAPQKNKWINNLHFIYTMTGPISNFNGSMDWLGLNSQIIDQATSGKDTISKSIGDVEKKAAGWIHGLFNH